MRRKKTRGREPTHFKVEISQRAKRDMDRICMTSKDVATVRSFLQSDACRLIGQRQRRLCERPDLWYARCAVNGCGKSSGGRLLYYRQVDNGLHIVTIARVFRKKQVENGKNELVCYLFRVINALIVQLNKKN